MTAPAPSVRRGVRAFLALTFGLTWLPFLPVLVGGPALPLLMPVAPALASLVVRRWVTCEHCDRVMTWTEGATPAGSPNGRVTSGPQFLKPPVSRP